MFADIWANDPSVREALHVREVRTPFKQLYIYIYIHTGFHFLIITDANIYREPKDIGICATPA